MITMLVGEQGNEEEAEEEAEEDARHPRTLRRFATAAFDVYLCEAGAFDAGEADIRREMAKRRRKAVLAAIDELASLRERSGTTAPRGRPGGKGRPPRDPVEVAEDAQKARVVMQEVARLLEVPPLPNGAPLSQIARAIAAHVRRT